MAYGTKLLAIATLKKAPLGPIKLNQTDPDNKE